MKQCKNRDEAHERSELFRLYCMHIDLCNNFGKSWYKRKNKDNCTINTRIETIEVMFYDFLMILYSIQQTKMEQNNLAIKPRNKIELDEQLDYARDEIVQLITHEENNNKNEAKGSETYYYQILNSNTKLLKHLFKHFKYSRLSSLKALVYGLRCKGRGYGKRRILVDGGSSANEYKLNLQKTWNTNKNEYSSWCKFRFNRFNTSNCKNLDNENDYFIGNPPKSEYGQMNFFIKLKLPTEEILHGVKIASMTAVTHIENPLWDFKDRDLKRCKSRTMIDCIDVARMTLVNNSLFIPFTDIYATKYGMIGVDQEDKPFFNKSNVSYINAKNGKVFSFSDEKSENISKLYFIPLHPERINVCYNVSNNEMYNR
jgi:hypothetical protein